jgi:hypothetical protein
MVETCNKAKNSNQYVTLSIEVFIQHTMFAVPISPLVENLTPSLLTEMTTTTCMHTKRVENISKQNFHNKTIKHQKTTITYEQVNYQHDQYF